jgi:hypothetical protein
MALNVIAAGQQDVWNRGQSGNGLRTLKTWPTTLTGNSATTVRVPALGGPSALLGGPKDIDKPPCLRLPLD